MRVSLPYAGSWPFSQRFGSNAGAYARFNMKGHNGVDVACAAGTPLLACVDAVVTERRNDATGYGLYAVLTDAAGGEWLYGHGSSWSVKEGDRVAAGQRLGTSGSTGNSTGPHLHFGYRPYGYDRSNGYLGYVNPRPHLPLPYRVLLQEGHVGAVPASGAPREAEWTGWIAPMIAAKLNAAGVQTGFIGDFFNAPDAAEARLLEQDWDVFWAIHYDAAIYKENTGCCVARGEYETEWWEADRLLAHWTGRYPTLTAIPLRQERVNPNMTRYYAYRHLTYVTPGVVVEHGVGAPGAGLDAPKLWGEPDAVAGADAGALLAYLSVAAPPGDGAGGAEEVPVDTTPEERAAMKGDFEALGIPVNMETALMKRAALARKRQEWRGPALTGEYAAVNREGKIVVRQKFSGGALDYHQDTGETFWTEPMLYPEDAR